MILQKRLVSEKDGQVSSKKIMVFRDVERMRALAGDRPLVVTEKDAVKLAAHAEALGSAYVLTEELRWAWGEDALARRLDALVVEAARR